MRRGVARFMERERIMKRRNHWFVVLLMTLFCAFAFAVTYVLVFTWTLPQTDLAHGQKPFADPMVLPIMATLTIPSAILAFPFVYLAIRHRRLGWCLLIMLAVVLLEIVAVTPVLGIVGFLGAFPALAIALLLCYLCAPTLTWQRGCPACGYEIAEGVGPRCSECGATLPWMKESPT
jgi:hypothetical protein